MEQGWQLYMQTAAGMLYTGITTDVNRRLQQHQQGAVPVRCAAKVR